MPTILYKKITQNVVAQTKQEIIKECDAKCIGFKYIEGYKFCPICGEEIIVTVVTEPYTESM